MGYRKQAIMKSTKATTNKNWVVYILRCRDNTLYTGITNNVEKRLASHNKGTASRYTRARLPVTMVAASGCMTKAEALRLEIKIKKQPKEKKLIALAAAQHGETSPFSKEDVKNNLKILPDPPLRKEGMQRK